MVVEYSNKNMNYEKAFINKIAQTPPVWRQGPYYDDSKQKQLDHDAYIKIYNAKPLKTDEFPRSLKYVLGVLCAGSVILFGKNILKGLKTFIKNFPK